MAIKPKLTFDQDGNHRFEAEVRLDMIGGWEPTIARVRDAVFKRHIVGMGLQNEVSKLFAPRQSEVEAVNQAVFDAMTAGRVIDFGFFPNEVMKESGQRGGHLYSAGHIGMPFRDPFVIFHTWDAGSTHDALDRVSDRTPAVYLVQLTELDMPAGGEFEALELQPVVFDDHQALMIGDRIIAQHDPEQGGQLHAKCLPAVWRAEAFMRGIVNDGDVVAMMKSGAGNVVDPLMTALMILATDGIDRRTIPAPVKLNKQRAKHPGRFPIPPYDVVDTGPYITALQAKRTPRRKSEPLGGHHASPVMHLRRGHPRTYESGRRTWIRDSLINATPQAREAFLVRQRSHYQVQP